MLLILLEEVKDVSFSFDIRGLHDEQNASKITNNQYVLISENPVFSRVLQFGALPQLR